MQPSNEGQTGSCFVPPSENEEGACQSRQEGTAETSLSDTVRFNKNLETKPLTIRKKF